MRKSSFTASEIAKICGVTRFTVNNWIHKGILRAYRSMERGRWHVQQDELYSFIKRQGYPTDLLNRESTRILIIDDEFGITKLIMTALSGLEDVIIDYAQSGFSAGTKLEAMKPHIVILDIYVGDIDGREFFKHIRSNPELNDIKVIGISGRMTDEEVRNLYDMGFDEFIAKPFKLKRSETNCIRFYPRLMPWSD